jgi:hypothetical protein
MLWDHDFHLLEENQVHPLVAIQSTSAIKNKKLTNQRSVGRVPSPGGPTPVKGTEPTIFGSGSAGLDVPDVI